MIAFVLFQNAALIPSSRLASHAAAASASYRYDKRYGDVWQSIEALDRKGMALIESLDPQGFSSYLRSFRNTICGRHPIGVFLNAIVAFKDKQHPKMKFVHYAQSSKVRYKQDSSVSYAAAVCHFCSNQDDDDAAEGKEQKSG